jgi:signal transduction histidine kinase/putative methionine-R-sulfoxide reductase with GAF domain
LKVARSSSEQTLLERITSTGLEAPDRKTAFKQLTSLGRDLLNSQACMLTFVDTSLKRVLRLATASTDAFVERALSDRSFQMDSGGDGINSNVVTSGKILKLVDLTSDGQGVCRSNQARKYHLHSLLAYPLRLQDQVLGYFNHFSKRGDFNRGEEKIIALLGRQTLLVIQKFERDSLSRLNRLLAETTEASGEDDLLASALDGALEMLGVARGWVALLDPKTKIVNITKHHRGNLPRQVSLTMAQGITGRCVQSGKPIRAHDVRSKEWNGVYEAFWPDTLSELAAPIVVENALVRIGTTLDRKPKPLGVINAESSDIGTFLPFDERCLVTVARHVANILERLEGDRKVTALTDIQRRIVGKARWDDVISTLSTSISDTLGYDYVNVSLVNHVTNSIKVEHVVGLPMGKAEDFKASAFHLLDSSDIQADIVRTGNVEVPVLDDVRFDPDLIKVFGLDRIVRVFLPLRAGPARPPLGTVSAGYQTGYTPYIYERDINILKQLTDYAAAALERRLRISLDHVVHEIRAPVVGIRSNVSFLRQRWKRLPELKIARKLEDLGVDCDILEFQARQIEYAFAGGESRSYEFAPVFVYRDVIIKTLSQLLPLFADKKIRPNQFHWAFVNPHKLELWTDRLALSQVIYNLLMNSLKYCGDPSTFFLEVSNSETPDRIALHFADYGIGIPAGLEEMVFEEGFRAPNAVRVSTGSGIGLALARRIARDLGGELSLRHNAEPTAFELSLPKKHVVRGVM